MTTPEPAVSPAPDTEALRQQVAEALNQSVSTPFANEVSLAAATDAVLALPWIKYAAGQRHVVTMHEQNNAALAKTNREWAEEYAGLRADLDRARVERDARQQVLDEIREHLDLPDTAGLAMVESTARVAIQTSHDLTAENERLRAEVERLETLVLEKHELIQGWARYGERVKADRARFGDMLIAALGLQHEPVSRHFHRLVPAAVQELARLRVELARVSGARPIPDDAAERVAEALRTYQLSIGPNTSDSIARGMTRVHLSGGERRDIGLIAAQALGATPTTGPAPAAADVQWGIEFAGHVVRPQSSEAAAREYVDWHNRSGATGANRVALVSRTVSEWQPAAPQAPAAREDTAPSARHETSIREDTKSVRGPGWYIADCDTCDWTSSGSEPVVEVAAAEHEDEDDAHRADTLRPTKPLTPIQPEEA